MTETEQPATRVSTLELFFDLVFVFTVTQVALIVEEDPTWTAVARALLELAVIFWMYGGFGWLTNSVGTTRPRDRVTLLAGMAGLLVVSLATPRAFGADGIAFGVAYLLLNAVHLAGFLAGGGQQLSRAMREVGARNLAAAALVLAAGVVGSYGADPWAEPARWAGWVAAVLLQWPASLAPRTQRRFSLDAAHFGERHGLMILIVLGESLVSVALAAEQLPVTGALVAGVLAGLACSAGLWWCYFATDDERAAEAFGRRGFGSNALLLYDLPHMIMMAGVLGLAAGSRLSLPDLLVPTRPAAAVLIGVGTALYLVGLALFRALLGYDQPWARAVAALLLAATAFVGIRFGAGQQLAAATAVIVLMLLVERRVGRRPSP